MVTTSQILNAPLRPSSRQHNIILVSFPSSPLALSRFRTASLTATDHKYTHSPCSISASMPSGSFHVEDDEDDARVGGVTTLLPLSAALEEEDSDMGDGFGPSCANNNCERGRECLSLNTDRPFCSDVYPEKNCRRGCFVVALFLALFSPFVSSRDDVVMLVCVPAHSTRRRIRDDP
jgi:hypothetical protein